MKRRMFKLHMVALISVFTLSLGLLSVESSAEPKDEKYQDIADRIAEETNTPGVKTIWWKAKTTAKIKTTNTKTEETIKLKKGTKLTIVQRDYHEMAGVSQCMLKDGTECYIANKYLKIIKPLATGSKGDYSEETKLAYVNNQSISSKTDTLVWISLDKQRVNVFKGSKNNWELVRAMKTSTGKEDAPTLDVSFKSYYEIQKKQISVNSLQYYTFFYGSGMHKWPGPGMKKYIGKRPMSHSCVRLSTKDAKWVYDNENVPLKSRVWIW